VIKERGIRVKTGRLVVLAVIPIIFGLASLPVSNSSALAPWFSDTVSVCPDSTWSADGEVLTIGICISSGMTGVVRYTFSVTFDSSVIEILNAEEGPLPASYPGDSYFYWYDAGMPTDSIRVSGVVVGGAVNGPGELVTLTFKSKSHSMVATTDVVVADSELRNSLNELIGHETRNGVVTVEPIQVVAVCPDSTSVSEGEVFAIGLCFSAGMADVMGYNMAVTFDSSVIEIMNVEEGLLPPTAGSSFFWWYDAGVKTDSVCFNGAVLGETMDGPGGVAILTFKAKTNSVLRSTDVVIAYSELRDEWNEPVDHEARHGFVRIEPPTGVGPPAKAAGGLSCYPNPFNPTVTLVFSPPEPLAPEGRTDVTIRVFTAEGRLVRTLFDGPVGPGGGKFVWDGKDRGGRTVASGVYFVVADTGSRTYRTKIVMVR
jgi:hypothetical protein